MEPIGVDFETYYDREYSLSKMTTEEYIRSPLFEALVVSLHSRKGLIGTASGKQVIELVRSVDWANSMAVAWNCAFDGAILAWRMGVRPKAYACSMSLWRAMGFNVYGGQSLAAAARYGLEQGWPVRPKGDEVVNALGKRLPDFSAAELRAYERYCEDDAYNALALFDKMLALGFPGGELFTHSEVLRCFTEPRIVLDVPKLRDIHGKHLARMHVAMGKARIESLDELRSDEKFAAALRAIGMEPPIKFNKKGMQKYAFAKTDEWMQEASDSPDEVVASLVQARLTTKSTITESRTQRLIGIGQRGRMPVWLNTSGAHTHRLSGGDKINPQNFSKKDGTRDAIMAPPGYTMVVADQSQVEARFVAYVAGQTDLVEGFRNKQDIYCEFGNRSGVFDYEVTKATVDARFVCKGCIAEGELVLTDKGLVPIEAVTTQHRVWDGIEWVRHAGLVDQGVQEVITYAGLTATPDHIVWTEAGRAIPLGDAATQRLGIVAAGDGGQAVRVGHCHEPEAATWARSEQIRQGVSLLARQRALRGLPTSGRGGSAEPAARQNRGVSLLRDREAANLPGHSSGSRQPLAGEVRGDGRPLQAWGAQTLQRTRDSVSFRVSGAVHPLPVGEPAARKLPRGGDRPGGQRWALRAGQPPTSHASGEQQQSGMHGVLHGERSEGAGHPRLRRGSDAGSAGGVLPANVRELGTQGGFGGADHRTLLHGQVVQTRRVYDLANAGPRHRFTVSGRLVHNCVLGGGFGAGAGAMERQVRNLAFALGLNVDLDQDWPALNRAYRTQNVAITRLWRGAQHALERMVEGESTQFGQDGLMRYDAGRGFVLPNGLVIWYRDLRWVDVEEPEYPLPGEDLPKRVGERELYFDQQKWRGVVATRIYGPKAVENAIQSLAGLSIREAWGRIVKRCRKELGINYGPIAMQVHDELDAIVRTEVAQDYAGIAQEELRRPPTWAPGIPLDAEVSIGQRYGEAKG